MDNLVPALHHQEPEGGDGGGGARTGWWGACLCVGGVVVQAQYPAELILQRVTKLLSDP